MKAPGPKRKGPHRWKGELAKPLFVGVALTNKNLKNLNARLEQTIYESRVEKLPLLMEHYRIADMSDYFRLALDSQLTMSRASESVARVNC
jgi:hypothetical protein